jgi:hypothetical protein
MSDMTGLDKGKRFISFFGLSAVMPGLVPGHPRLSCKQDVDGRDKPGHDTIKGSGRAKVA